MQDEAHPTRAEDVKVVIPGRTSDDSKERRCNQRRCVKILTVLVVILLLIIAGLIAAFFLYDDDDDDGGENPNKQLPEQEQQQQVCTDRHCVINAGIISQKMDPSVDPCENFADYACGGYYKEASLPRHLGRIGSFLETSLENHLLVRDILETEVTSDDPEYLVKLKDVYWSCINEEGVGIQHFLNSSFASMWPTLNPNWDAASFDLNKLMIEYASHDIMPLWSLEVLPDGLNTSEYIIFFESPSDYIVPAEELVGPRNSSAMQAAQTYMQNLAVAMGADPEVARLDTEEVLDLHIRLAARSESSSQAYYIFNMIALDYNFPNLPLRSAIQATFNKTDIQLPLGLLFYLQGMDYFEALYGILNETNPRTIQNLFSVFYASQYADSLTEELRDVRFELDREEDGAVWREPWWIACLREISDVMWLGVGKEMVKAQLPNETYMMTYINDMVDSVMSEFSDVLDEIDWMTNLTQAEAKLKLDHMGRKIGYPDDDFSESDLNDLYKNLSFHRDNYFENRRILQRYYYTYYFKRLEEPVDKSRWETALVPTNAFYNLGFNQIVIPMGILRPTFFSENYPDSMNYGNIGSVIGHEITHGFDNSGSLHDQNGNLRNWWQPEDRSKFNDKLQCVIYQYNNFTHPQVKVSLNGEKNVGEAVADSVGLKLAYRAFRQKHESSPTKELPLPGLGLTPYQQFYLAYSQRYCQLHRDQWLVFQIRNKYHPPGRFRIIGGLQSDENFGDVFNCKPGSYMNPVDKCIVW